MFHKFHLITFLSECGKGPKRIFAPPAQKSYNLIPFSPNSPKEETLGISPPETEARISLPKARLKKEEKATTNNASSRGQEKKRKAQNNKQAEKKEKEKSSLTNAEFEEIVQIVLQKSLQERLGMGSGLDFSETSCAQPIVSTQSDKEPGITASATDTDNADGEEVPQAQEISVSWEGVAVPEIRTPKLGQPDPAPSEKKSSRLSLSKRKTEAGDEKVEKTQSGHELRQKDQLKKTVQDHFQIRDQQKGERSGFDQCLVWVQCSFPNCGKWRRLCGNVDPSVLPDNWSCDQNTDMEYNRCDIPEETWTGLESDVAYASYVPGSIIWAKQYGYPWWPGMIESDPDLGEYFLFTSHLDSLPSKYHVTFFGETVSRAWIPVNMLKNFQELSLEPSGMKKCRNKDCSQKLGVALMMAQEAKQISIQDPTLPSCNQVKTQTKKNKPRGMTGRGRTLQRKIMKRSLDRKSTAPPAPRMERKEGQGNSDSDQPGPKKKFKAPQSKALAASFSEGKEVRTVPKDLGPSACEGACPSAAKEEPRPRQPLTQKAGSVSLDDETSSDLDLEQLTEDVGRELGQSGELQHSYSDGEDFSVALLGK
ncbi:zinc finger CW-type PWWP domain protein 1 isoform X3 [Aotus nancymaae]|uniref:zinc finger CW-type PWWP domain protein 1 isoform X3 n=1 Tax=Aotus nancymaae TaxID=37293 RepID=UPI0030FE2BB1